MKFLFSLILLLSASLRSYSDESQQIEDILQLEDLLNEKISSASKYEQDKCEAPASVIIITSEEIQRYSNLTFTDILNKIRGFYTRTDLSYSYVGVRGFDRPSSYSNNVLLLIDGHNFNENVYGQPYYTDDIGFNLQIIDHIEIVQGPGSMLYGAGALLSIINIITKKGKDIDGLNLAGEISTSRSAKGDLIFGKEISEGFDLLLSARFSDLKGSDLFFEEFNNPDENFGIAEDRNWEKYYGIKAKLKYGDLQLSSFIFSREKGTPTAAYESIFNDPFSKSSDKREYVKLIFNPKLSETVGFMVSAAYDYYQYRGFYAYESNQQDGNDGRWATFESQINWDISPNNTIVAGVSYIKNFEADYWLEDEDTSYFDQNFPFSVYSIFVQDSWQIYENFMVNIGARFDENSLSKGFISPRVALIYNPFDNGAIKLLYATAFRSPNIYELYYEDDGSDIANPNLRPEKINSYEIVWEQIFSRNLSGTISFFHYIIDDLIDQKIVIDDEMELNQFQNNEKVDAFGFEFDLNAKYDSGLWFFLNFSHQIVNDNFDKRLTNSPSFIIKAGISQSFEPIRFGADFLFESSRITVYNTETDPFLISNLFIGFDSEFEGDGILTDLLNRFNIQLKLNNIFDIKYKLPGGFEHRQSALPQSGRSVLFEIKLRVI